jgi:hypothetical protein
MAGVPEERGRTDSSHAIRPPKELAWLARAGVGYVQSTVSFETGSVRYENGELAH